VLRVLGILVAVLCTAAAAILTFPGVFRVDRFFPVAQIVSFRGLIAIAFFVAALVALLLTIARPLRALGLALAVIAGAAGVANVVILTSRGLGTQELPAQTDTSIRVMTWNTAGDATPPDAIAQMAVAMSADVVTLPETTIETGEQVAILMRDLGRPMWAHHVNNPSTVWDAGSTTILIAPELGDYSVIESSRDGSSNTSTVPSAVAMPTSGEGPIIVAAHAVAPRPSAMQSWRDDLQWLADQCADANVIMAGDFNATLDHMTGLGVDGGTMGLCHDAAAETGNGAVGTWTTELPPLAGAPIDHVMVSPHWRATGSLVVRSLDGSGSDHRPLVVQLEPSPGR
jgi:endonuclease/exonuclease/phosphatase (EEP) superfamily protein YafD